MGDERGTPESSVVVLEVGWRLSHGFVVVEKEEGDGGGSRGDEEVLWALVAHAGGARAACGGVEQPWMSAWVKVRVRALVMGERDRERDDIRRLYRWVVGL